MTRLVRRLKLRSERAMALPLTVLVMASTGAMVVTVVEYSSSSGRTAQIGKGRVSAYSLAEAGIANALSVLNNAVDPKTASLLPGPCPATPSVPGTVVQMGGGTATYWGCYDSATYKWTLNAIGAVPNPTGGAALTKTLSRSAQVHGLNSGATVGAWNRMYHDNTSTCLTIEDVTIPTPIASRGDICLVGSGKITGAQTTVEVGDDVIMYASNWQWDRSPGAGSGWTNPGNVVSSNGSKASAAITANTQSAYLHATGFGYSIPTGSTITGIRAWVERSASSEDSVDDQDVYLLKAGAQAGSNRAKSGYYDDSDNTQSYGTSTDLWGTTWTAEDINNANFGLRFRADNDAGGSRTAYVDYIEIRVYYTPPPDTSIGVPGTNVLQAHIGDTCTYGAQPAHKPCTAVDNVFASTITTSPSGLSKPQIDMAFWYTNAKPGPKQSCTTAVGTPPVFDNDSTYNKSLPVDDAWSEVTPTTRSYTCQVRDAQSNLLGELSWNHTTHVLTIFGTIFLDGDFRFDDNGQVVHYQGRGIIYAARDIEFDELVCAGGSGTTSCVTQAGGMSNWDPSANMMTVLAGDDSEFDQGSSSDQPASTPSGLQGIIYAVDDCTVHENFHLSGPIICDTIDLPWASNGWPTYYPWPPLGSLVDGQAYGSPNAAADYLVTAGDQLG
jgi:hypothetical protein